jgi:hypothetical protein
LGLTERAASEVDANTAAAFAATAMLKGSALDLTTTISDWRRLGFDMAFPGLELADRLRWRPANRAA